jgi:hypothetical protein
VGTSTLERSTRDTKSRKAKSNSKVSFRALFARPVEDTDQEPERFSPDGQSRWLLDHFKGELSKAVAYLVKQQKPPVAASPTDLDGSHPAYLLRHIGMRALDKEIDPELTFQGAVEHLQAAWDMLLERAAAEAAFERHAPVNAAEAAADGALLAAAGRRGKAIGPDSQRGQVVAAEIVDRAVKAPEPTDLQLKMTPDVLARLDAGESPESVEASLTQTAVMPAVEAAMVPAAAGSPVHVPGDRVSPAIPDVDEVADPGEHKPLPRRIPYGYSGEVVQAATDTEATR